MNDRIEQFLTGLVALVGVTALGLALALALIPDAVPIEPLEAALAPVLANESLVVLGAGGLAAVATYQAFVGGDADSAPAVDLPDPPSTEEDVGGPTDVEVAGEWVDERLAKIRGEEDVNSRVGLAITKKRVRERLTELAVDVLVDTEGCSRERAQAMLDEGTWTDRTRAQVFLGGESVPDLPLSVRVRDWASGEGFERQVRTTVEELAERAGVEVGVSMAPAPVGVDRTTEETDGWRPEVDAREAAAPVDREFDPDGLYRRDMFEDLELDLDEPGTDGDSGETESTDAETADTGEVLETGGERT